MACGTAETLDIGSDWRCPIVFDDEECSPLLYEPRPQGANADASMAACATNGRHHSVQAAGQADLGGTDTGADSMGAIAQQVKVHEIKSDIIILSYHAGAWQLL